MDKMEKILWSKHRWNTRGRLGTMALEVPGVYITPSAKERSNKES
jgi:hypothetical protein